MDRLVPIVDLTEGRIAGAEALARWPRPDGGTVGPGTFIPLAEETGLIDCLLETFAESDLDPERVAFEVTESVAMESSGVLQEIRRLGSPVAVDDFGTQYATLKRLAELEVYSVKLDRLFVSGIGESTRHEAVLEASLTLADAIGLFPVAEGIESEQQRRGPLDRGCRFGQRYLSAEAVSAKAFTRMLTDQTSDD